MTFLLCLLLQADIFQPAPATPVAAPVATARTLTVFHATWCGPCVNWEQNEQPKLEAAGVKITRVDIDADNIAGVTRIPAFWVMENGKVISKTTGYTSAASLLTLLKVKTQVPAPAQKQGNVSFQPQQTIRTKTVRPTRRRRGIFFR